MPWGYWLPKAVKGVDVRQIGSGNVGAANVWRTFGLRWGLAVAALDVAKGVGAALIGMALAGEVGGITAGIAALVGHWRPLFLRFARGGKIVATPAGQAARRRTNADSSRASYPTRSADSCPGSGDRSGTAPSCRAATKSMPLPLAPVGSAAEQPVCRDMPPGNDRSMSEDGSF